MAGRRERLRAETTRDIKAAALARLREDGDVSLRAVARDIGMSAPGLYRYYDSRDDLLTALISDGYHDLADALEAALGLPSTRPPSVGGAPSGTADRRPAAPVIDVSRARGVGAMQAVRGTVEASPDLAATARTAAPGLSAMRTSALAYRTWSVTNPNVFGLLFGDPLPGYAAPPGGETVTANRRVGSALLQPLVVAVLGDEARVPRAYAAAADTDEMRGFQAELAEVVGMGVPDGLGPLALGLWGRLHGLVSLEVFGQFHWVYPAGAAQLFEADVDAMIAELAV